METYDWLFEEPSEIIENSPNISEPIWTTKAGNKIPLSKMTSRHICNCIKLLESRNLYKHKFYRIFKEELKRRKSISIKTNFIL